MASNKCPLIFNVMTECQTTKARVSKMILPHSEVDTPVFMPVGTQVSAKSVIIISFKALIRFRVL